MEKVTKDVMIQVRITNSLKSQLAWLAAQNDQSVGSIVREAIEKEIKSRLAQITGVNP